LLVQSCNQQIAEQEPLVNFVPKFVESVFQEAEFAELVVKQQHYNQQIVAQEQLVIVMAEQH